MRTFCVAVLVVLAVYVTTSSEPRLVRIKRKFRAKEINRIPIPETTYSIEISINNAEVKAYV
jgi:hypothetical protein